MAKWLVQSIFQRPLKGDAIL